MLESLSIKVSKRESNFIKKRIQPRKLYILIQCSCFLVNIVKILRVAFLIEQLWWLLLYIALY